MPSGHRARWSCPVEHMQHSPIHRTPGALPSRQHNADLAFVPTDREAQRAIRERTKNQIEGLENRIHELESSHHHKELQAALQAKERVEVELAELKATMASIMSQCQAKLGPRQGQ
jgi:hypothetical protein